MLYIDACGVCVCHQQMRRTGNKDENKRILMDLDVVLKSHDCPYIIQCYGAIVTNVGLSLTHTHTSVMYPVDVYHAVLNVPSPPPSRRTCSSPWS